MRRNGGHSLEEDRMRKILFLLALVTLVLPVRAATVTTTTEDKDKADEQFIAQGAALGAARTKAELAFRKISTFFQNQAQTYHALPGRIDELHGKIQRLLDTKLQAEKNRLGDEFNQTAIDTLNNRKQDIEPDYQAFQQREREGYNTRFRNCEQRFRAVEQIFNQLQNMEKPWKDAGLDVTGLQSTYDMVTKGMADAKAQADDVIKDVNEKIKVWEKMLAEIAAPDYPPHPAPPPPPPEKPGDKPAEGQKPLEPRF
jgi:hypothetical protein